MDQTTNALYAIGLAVLALWAGRRVWRSIFGGGRHFYELKDDEPINFYAAKVARESSKRFKKTNLLSFL